MLLVSVPMWSMSSLSATRPFPIPLVPSVSEHTRNASSKRDSAEYTKGPGLYSFSQHQRCEKQKRNLRILRTTSFASSITCTRFVKSPKTMHNVSKADPHPAHFHASASYCYHPHLAQEITPFWESTPRHLAIHYTRRSLFIVMGKADEHAEA